MREGAGGDERELVARIFVCPSDNAEVVRAGARRAIAAYMNVPVYAAFQEWLGRGEQLGGMWAAWKAGDRKRALDEIPDEVVDDLVVHGTPEQCRTRIEEYFEQRCHRRARWRSFRSTRSSTSGTPCDRWRRAPSDVRRRTIGSGA